jgi:hypothetical protein
VGLQQRRGRDFLGADGGGGRHDTQTVESPTSSGISRLGGRGDLELSVLSRAVLNGPRSGVAVAGRAAGPVLPALVGPASRAGGTSNPAFRGPVGNCCNDEDEASVVEVVTGRGTARDSSRPAGGPLNSPSGGSPGNASTGPIVVWPDLPGQRGPEPDSCCSRAQAGYCRQLTY